MINRITNRSRARERPIKSPLAAICFTAINLQTRVFVFGQANIRVALVVPEQNVVARVEIFNQVVFKQQCLAFGAGIGNFDLMNISYQRQCFCRKSAVAKIAGQTVFQIFGLADIDHLTIGIHHAVDTGHGADSFQEGPVIEAIDIRHNPVSA